MTENVIDVDTSVTFIYKESLGTHLSAFNVFTLLELDAVRSASYREANVIILFFFVQRVTEFSITLRT